MGKQDGRTLTKRKKSRLQCGDLTDSYWPYALNWTTISCWILLLGDEGMEFWEVASGLLAFTKLLLNELMVEERSSYP